MNEALEVLLKSTVLSQVACLAMDNCVHLLMILCQSERWTCQKGNESSIDAVEMIFLRKICGVTLADQVRNNKSETDGVKMSKGMLRWFRHIEREADERRNIYIQTKSWFLIDKKCFSLDI